MMRNRVALPHFLRGSSIDLGDLGLVLVSLDCQKPTMIQAHHLLRFRQRRQVPSGPKDHRQLVPEVRSPTTSS